MSMTILEFSRAIGVSTATVWRAINGAKGISPETRDMVVRRMEELGYRPNQAARALVRGQSEVVSLWMPSLGTRYDVMIINEVQKLLGRDRFEMLVRDMSDSRPGDRTVATLLRWPVDGILVVDGAHWVREFLRRDIPGLPPMVGVGTYADEHIDCVSVDLRAGACAAVQHLYDTGCRRIACLMPEYFLRMKEGRVLGYEETMAALGLKAEFIVPALSNRLSAAQAVEDHVKRHGVPEGLFCFNDDNAIGAFSRLRELGARVPEDICLVGCDGIEDTLYTERKLSTLAIPLPEMCASAWQFLQRRMETPDLPRQRLSLKPSLIIRESSSGRGNRAAN